MSKMSQYPPAALNAIAGALMREFGWLPFSVRYDAAAAACEVVQAHEAKRAAWDADMSNEPTDDVRQGLALLALARQAAAARAAMNAATERKEMMDSQRHAAVELAHQAAVDYQHHEDAYLAALEGVGQ